MYYSNPLSYHDWLEAIIEQYDAEFASYYPESAAGIYEPERDESLYRGSNVIWDGIEGHMIRVPSENIAWEPQNILDPQKLAAVAQGIKEGDDIILRAGWGRLHKVDLQTIRESIEYARDDEYGVLTTGDEELDEFLVDPGEVLTNYHDTDEPEAFCEKYQEFTEALKTAEKNEEGDIGKWLFTPVDGHHRIWGAILAGEPYIWVILSTNQIEDAKHSRMPEDTEIAEMLEQWK